MGREIVLGLALSVLGGCASIPSGPVQEPVARSGVERECIRLLAAIDSERDALGVRDADAAPVPGFPYLRIDRFATAWGGHLSADERGDEFARWVDYLRGLDREARAIELRNAGVRLHLSELAAPPLAVEPGKLESRLDECGERLRAHDLSTVAGRRALLERAETPASYSSGKRFVGLYPFTSIPFAYGVSRLHRDTRAVFATPLDELPVAGELQRFAPARAGVPVPIAQAADSMRRVAREDIRRGETPVVRQLLDAHAPVWEVDVHRPLDRIGSLGWAGESLVHEPGDPVVYRYVSLTYLDDRPAVQLNYVAWFGARPASGVFDVLAGHLDGITWRVTLNEDGTVYLADAMHNCGCYHMVFPSRQAAVRSTQPGQAAAAAWEEPILVPARLPDYDPDQQRLVLRIAAGTHYLQRVYAAVPAVPAVNGIRYQVRAYDVLRSLPAGVLGRRSAFRPDGLVEGTERPERWLFWPMGVASAGAMRQRGHHAIAFVGRRHFDDPHLFARYFTRVPRY